MTLSCLVEVVDDDPDLRQTLAMVLRSQGYAVREHLSAQAFLSSPPTQAPRVLLLDVQMPQMTGFELQAHLAQAGLCMPLIFMSGLSTPLEKMPIGVTHAVAFLRKPFTAEALLKAIEEGFKRCETAQPPSTSVFHRDEIAGCLACTTVTPLAEAMQIIANSDSALRTGDCSSSTA
jgi:FixJ family two-component response regulator